MPALGAADASGALRSCTGAPSHYNVALPSVGHTNERATLTREEECQIHFARSLRSR
jgi:hypothetical protein